MLIGVDCKYLLETNKSGTHNYLLNLLKNLSVEDSRNEYILYFNSAPAREFWEELSNMNPKWSYREIHSKISWVQEGLSRATFEDRPNVLLCSWHTVPVFHRSSTKIISIIHDFTCSFYKSYPIYVSLLCSNKLVGVSDHTYSQILKRVPFKKHSIYRIYEGVDLSKFKKVDKDEITKVQLKYGITEKYFLSVGTLNRRKNLENMIKAFTDVSNTSVGEGFCYALAGQCEKGYEDIYKYAGDKIKFLGRVDNEDVVALYSGASALLYASFAEGFGLPILEAFACLCPVITSNNTSMKEIGGTGAYLVNPLSVDDIADNMRNVLIDSDSVAKKVLLGSERAKQFSWESCARKIIELY